MPDPKAAPAQWRNPGKHCAPGPGLGLLPTPRLAGALPPATPKTLLSNCHCSTLNPAYYNCSRFLTWKPVIQTVSADTICSVCTKLQVATHKLQTSKNQATSHFYCEFPASIKTTTTTKIPGSGNAGLASRSFIWVRLPALTDNPRLACG